MSGEYRKGENQIKLGMAVFKAVWLMSGSHEKGMIMNPEYLYPEPALVPWMRSLRYEGVN